MVITLLLIILYIYIYALSDTIHIFMYISHPSHIALHLLIPSCAFKD